MNFGEPMAERRRPQAGIRLLFTLAVPIFLALGSSRLLLSHAFLRFEYQRAGFPADPYGFTQADRNAYGMYAIDYIFNGEPIAFLARLRLPREKCFPPSESGDCALFSQAELSHMRDVKTLIRLAYSAALALALVALAALGLSYRSRATRRAIASGLRRGSRLTLVLICAGGGSALLSWNRAFDAFHELLFAAGTWRFPYSDSLIRLYPEQIFVDAALGIALLCCLGALGIHAIVSRSLEL